MPGRADRIASNPSACFTAGDALCGEDFTDLATMTELAIVLPGMRSAIEGD